MSKEKGQRWLDQARAEQKRFKQKKVGIGTHPGKGSVDLDSADLEDMMLSNVNVDDEHKFNIPIDLGLDQGSYGITVSTNTDMDINALADPGGIAPAYERRQRQDDLRAVGRRNKMV